VPANVAYPTDSGLLAKAIRRIGTTGQRIHAAGGGVRTRLRDRSRAAGGRAHGIAAKLRSRAQRRIQAVVATVLVVGWSVEACSSLLMRSDGRCQPSDFRGRSLISAATSASRSAL